MPKPEIGQASYLFNSEARFASRATWVDWSMLFENLINRWIGKMRCYCRCAEAKEQMPVSEERKNKKGDLHHTNWSRSAFASFKSEVSNPSVNQP